MNADATTGLLPWETAWLAWARPIVRMVHDNPAHFSWCRTALGPAEYPDTPADPAGDPTLRWPGYVGARWRPGHGVLFVGSVHSDFTKDGRRAGDAARHTVVADMVAANTRWRDSADGVPEEGARYLSATRHAYATLIPGWARDTAFGEVRRRLGDGVDEIAWTNLAHCRAQPRCTPGGEYRLQAACSGVNGAYPISHLLAALRPAAVLACVSPLEGAHSHRFSFAVNGDTTPLLWTFNGATGKRDGVEPERWAEQFATAVRAGRATHR